MKLYFPEKRRNTDHLTNERGFALITVLVLSAVLMATMAIVMNSSTMETVMSGASTFAKRALTSADAGIEYVRGSFILVGSSFPSSTAAGNYTATAQGALPGPLNTEITFLNLSSMGVNNELLTNRGFSGRYSSPNTSGGNLTLQAHQSRVTSRAAVATHGKRVELEGYSLAP